MKSPANTCGTETLVERLAAKAELVLPDSNTRDARIYRIEADIDRLDPLDWLRVQDELPRTYWSDRDRRLQTAAVGAADIIRGGSSPCLAEALCAIRDRLASGSPGARYYGSIGFDQDDGAMAGGAFGRYYFVLPEFELCRENSRTVLAFNVVYPSGGRLEDVIKRLRNAAEGLKFAEPASNAGSAGKALNRTDFPGRSQWTENILGAVDTIKSNRVKKVVLARKSVFRMSRPVDPVILLRQVKGNSVRTYDFCFQIDPSHAFVGCSPECLYKRDGDVIYSEAVAGTCQAAASDADRRRFQEKLLNSPKEAEEHRYVFENIMAGLNRICRRVDVLEKRDIISLSYVQHFYSTFRGILRENIDTPEIIQTLHPTAAVHGVPRGAASEEIGKYEPFSRGWYAGPVGWIGRDSAEFAVGIRSGFVEGSQITLFAGAGILELSDPASEWDETESKLRHFLEILC